MKRIYLFLIMLLACGLQMATAKSAGSLGKFLVSSIAHDDQNIYIATKNGLVVIDKDTESQTLYNSENSSLPFNTDPDMEPYKVQFQLKVVRLRYMGILSSSRTILR